MGIQIVAQRPGDAFLLAAVAVRRIENLEKFNEIILELKRRPHGGRKALFLCVFAERNQVHPLQILFQLLPVGFRHGAGARQGENEILRRIVKFRRGAPGYVVRVKFIGQAVFAVGIEMHPARRGLFLADAAAAVRGIGGNDKKLPGIQFNAERILFEIQSSAVNIDKIKDISDRPALMDIAGAVNTSASDDKIRKGWTV